MYDIFSFSQLGVFFVLIILLGKKKCIEKNNIILDSDNVLNEGSPSFASMVDAG